MVIDESKKKKGKSSRLNKYFGTFYSLTPDRGENGIWTFSDPGMKGGSIDRFNNMTLDTVGNGGDSQSSMSSDVSTGGGLAENLTRMQIEDIRQYISRICRLPSGYVQVFSNGNFCIYNLPELDANYAERALRNDSKIGQLTVSNGQYDFSHFDSSLTPKQKKNIRGVFLESLITESPFDGTSDATNDVMQNTLQDIKTISGKMVDKAKTFTAGEGNRNNYKVLFNTLKGKKRIKAAIENAVMSKVFSTNSSCNICFVYAQSDVKPNTIESYIENVPLKGRGNKYVGIRDIFGSSSRSADQKAIDNGICNIIQQLFGESAQKVFKSCRGEEDFWNIFFKVYVRDCMQSEKDKNPQGYRTVDEFLRDTKVKETLFLKLLKKNVVDSGEVGPFALFYSQYAYLKNESEEKRHISTPKITEYAERFIKSFPKKYESFVAAISRRIKVERNTEIEKSTDLRYDIIDDLNNGRKFYLILDVGEFERFQDILNSRKQQDMNYAKLIDSMELPNGICNLTQHDMSYNIWGKSSELEDVEEQAEHNIDNGDTEGIDDSNMQTNNDIEDSDMTVSNESLCRGMHCPTDSEEYYKENIFEWLNEIKD